MNTPDTETINTNPNLLDILNRIPPDQLILAMKTSPDIMAAGFRALADSEASEASTNEDTVEKRSLPHQQ